MTAARQALRELRPQPWQMPGEEVDGGLSPAAPRQSPAGVNSRAVSSGEAAELSDPAYVQEHAHLQLI